ncbi:hypothetical protein [Agarivorans sp. QJM3NY_25]|uniref:hypothetical protein n=1 Tax=Agarivorans sp. QJM3NY_25 TaxID=3421430 RepID=UPI003D7E6779
MSFNINGSEPDIIGKLCQGFYLIQQQEAEVVTDPANTTFLKFDGEWVKLCFDGETIFWRDTELPSVPVNNCFSNCLLLLNLNEFEGVVGFEVKSISYDSNGESVFAYITFSSGITLKFEYHGYDDYTQVNC